VLSALLDLVLPQACAGCAAPTAWCAGCAQVLAAAACAPLGVTRPDPSPPGFPRAAAAAAYDGAVRGALLAHKERGRLSLGHPLGAALAAAVGCLSPPYGVVLVPVPSSRAAIRARGHDHALRLARIAAAVSTRAGQPARAARLLAPVRSLGDQSGLSAQARAANLSGAFAVVRTVPTGLPVVVVDDVVTTGASLAEATRALTAAGAAVHGAATVAATMRRSRRGYR
jgi:predicted amidophosphoribosyltransferase